MEEVEDLLNAWGLPELVPIFKANEINIHALPALTRDDIKELIPQVGPRALFVRIWSGWKNEFMTDLPSCNVSLSDIQVLALDGVEATSSSQTSPPKTITYTLIEESNNNTKTFPGEVIKDNLCDLYAPSTSKDSVTNEVQNNLFKLLSEDFGASSLLNYVGGALPNDPARNLLATTISKAILKTCKNEPITSSVYNQWCKEIKEIFPRERITSYYIPHCVTAQGITHQARGKLISQVFNLRRRYQKLGVLSRRDKNNLSLTSAASKTSRPFHDLPSAADSEIDCDITEDLLWLKNTSEPWTLVLSKWQTTFPKRFKDLKESGCTVEQYFNLFPGLKKPLGYNLLLKDFEALNPNFKDNLHLNFPHVKSKLINILSNKKTNTKDPVLWEIYELSNETDEEKSNLAAILSLPELINACVIARPSQVATTSACVKDPQPAKKRKVKETKWKPTKAEYRESFISHIKDDSYLTLTINKRHENILEKGLSPQPYVAIVGPNLQTIKSYFVIVNPKVFYNLPSILSAIDTCFKIIWSLNLEYSADCYGPWIFIQKGFYKLTSPFDKGSTNVESLLTDCNLI